MCVCVCARARARVRACVCVCVRTFEVKCNSGNRSGHQHGHRRSAASTQAPAGSHAAWRRLNPTSAARQSVSRGWTLCLYVYIHSIYVYTCIYTYTHLNKGPDFVEDRLVRQGVVIAVACEAPHHAVDHVYEDAFAIKLGGRHDPRATRSQKRASANGMVVHGAERHAPGRVARGGKERGHTGHGADRTGSENGGRGAAGHLRLDPERLVLEVFRDL